jgi:hypothetical protein
VKRTWEDGAYTTESQKPTCYGLYGLLEIGVLLGTRESIDLGFRLAAGVADEHFEKPSVKGDAVAGMAF